ncbi:PIR protein [Plasmodium ovale]|uniref:PIR Superfamily Protein n=2 Tax=Plasmodium ovale TaxID=36330 RepID=A0A1A8WRJ0_PLAOA|nr:PIR Superfamily Protein [Plasmodium ovale curtisi]SBT84570.1 PIR protein [Plasmodium ovale]
MALKIGTNKYTFCINSNYYEVLLKYVKDNKTDVDNEQNCDNLSTSMTFSENELAKNICQEFKFLCKSFSKYHYKKESENYAFSNYDYDFLNYWLNDKLRKNIKNGLIKVKEFYEEIKRRDGNFLYTPNDLEKYLHVIDPDILENMKLLYKLYDNAVIIINMMRSQDYPDGKQEEEQEKEEQKSCSEYTKECDENYQKAMDRCLNSNVDFYNALKLFRDSYKVLTEPSTDKLNICKPTKFLFFPKYDPVIEANQRRIMTFKIMSAPLMLPFVIPLLYKYTPLGPFLRTKINFVKERWLNPDEKASELLSMSTDTEDNISENEEFNIGYYSGTNL